MDNKSIISDILEMEKNMAVNMVYSMNESSNNKLYKEFLKIFEGISKESKEIFNIMLDKSMYIIDSVDKKKINEEKTKFINELNSLK